MLCMIVIGGDTNNFLKHNGIQISLSGTNVKITPILFFKQGCRFSASLANTGHSETYSQYYNMLYNWTKCGITKKKKPSTNLHIHLQGRSIGPMLQQSPSGSKTKKRVFPCLLITPFSVFPEQRVVTTYHRLSASPAPTGVPSYGGGGSGWLRPLRGMLRDWTSCPVRHLGRSQHRQDCCKVWTSSDISKLWSAVDWIWVTGVLN